MILKFNQTNFLKSEIIADLKKLNLKLSRQTEENFEYISFSSINSRSMNYSLSNNSTSKNMLIRETFTLSIIKNLDPVEISTSIKSFIVDNKVEERKFCDKVLQTSYLSYKNLIDSPQKWPILNSRFKLYYKRLFLFLNDKRWQKSFLDQAHNYNDDNEMIENNNFIHYDISQLELKISSRGIIESAIKKLNENKLNRKILCDAVLGIPPNTLSYLTTKINYCKNQSDYAKEAIMRMYAWLIDHEGVNKLLKWKKKYYSSI